MLCPSCGTKNNDYHLFCYKCGTTLTADDANMSHLYNEQDLSTISGDSDTQNENSESNIDASQNDWSKSEEQSPQNDWSNTDKEHSIIYDSPRANDEQAALNDWTKAKEELSATTDDNEKIPSNSAPTKGEADKPEGEADKPEGEKKAIGSIWSESIADDWWSLDYSKGDLLKDDNKDSEFNYQDQLPLRRYCKTEDEEYEGKLQKTVKAFVSIVLIAMIGVLLYIGYDQIKQKQSYQPEAKVIDLDYKIEETEQDGMPARKILIESSIGRQVKLLDKTAPVLKNQAEFILTDRDLALTGTYEENNGNLQIILNLTVLADGHPDLNEELRFEVPVHKAPLDIVSPSSVEAMIDGGTIQLILKVLPDSTILINDNHYSHLLDDQGNLSVQLEVPDQAETPIEIKVSARGFQDNIETIVFKRQQMEFPLVIDQNKPIQAQQSEWVEISGNTHPEAILSTNLTMQGDPEIDATTGDFKLSVRATARGYTPFILTAKLEGKEDSVLETLIERSVAEVEYTGSVWASDYQEMKSYPNLHHGVSFEYRGRIKDIQSSGIKTSLLVDVATQGQAERIIYVEYWKTGSFALDERIRVFGNYWGSKDDKPFILAYFIYK